MQDTLLKRLLYHEVAVRKSIERFFKTKPGFMEVSASVHKNSPLDHRDGHDHLPDASHVCLDLELYSGSEPKGVYCFHSHFDTKGRQIEMTLDFVARGGVFDLSRFLNELLCSVCGFDKMAFGYADASSIMQKLNVSHITPQAEEDFAKLCLGKKVISIFNMPSFLIEELWIADEEAGKKRTVDIIIDGMKVIRSAEYSCDKEQMARNFRSSGNKYRRRELEARFGGTDEKMIETSFTAYLDRTFQPRFGGSLSITRLIKVMVRLGLLPKESNKSTMPEAFSTLSK